MNYIIVVGIVLGWITGMCIYINSLTPTKYRRVIEFITLVLNMLPIRATINAFKNKNLNTETDIGTQKQDNKKEG